MDITYLGSTQYLFLGCGLVLLVLLPVDHPQLLVGVAIYPCVEGVGLPLGGGHVVDRDGPGHVIAALAVGALLIELLVCV